MAKKASLLIGCLVALAFASPAFAQTPTPTPRTTWTGISDSWFSCGKWDNGCPNASTEALINNGGKAAISTTGATAYALVLGENAGDSGQVDVNGGSLVLLPPAVIPEGVYPITGSIYVGNHDRGTLNITNGGTVSSWIGYIAALSGEFLTSNGTVTISGAGSTWTISANGRAALFIGGNGINPIDGGDQGGTALLTVMDGGAVIVNNFASDTAAVRVGLSGTLTGNGTITTVGSRRTAVEGTLAPTGTLTIDSNLFLGTSATMLCNVTPNANDIVNVSSMADLQGRLSVTMIGTTFTPGATYTLLQSGGLGPLHFTFDSVSIKYGPNIQCFTPIIRYDANNVYLYLQPCP